MVYQRAGLRRSSLHSQLTEVLGFFRAADPQCHVHQGRKKENRRFSGSLLLCRQRMKDVEVKKRSLADGLRI